MMPDRELDSLWSVMMARSPAEILRAADESDAKHHVVRDYARSWLASVAREDGWPSVDSLIAWARDNQPISLDLRLIGGTIEL